MRAARLGSEITEQEAPHTTATTATVACEEPIQRLRRLIRGVPLTRNSGVGDCHSNQSWPPPHLLLIKYRCGTEGTVGQKYLAIERSSARYRLTATLSSRIRTRAGDEGRKGNLELGSTIQPPALPN